MSDRPRQMSLAGFLIAGPVVHSHAIWRNPDREVPFLSADYYLDIARTLEAGCFDFLFFADRLGIGDRFGADKDTGLRFGDQDATRMDPVPVLAMIAAVTRHLGLGATRSTTYDQPYHLARAFRTLDHLSAGRAAWNVVTSMNDGEAANFGVDSHMGHDERYDRADEFLELACKLWDSWEPDALILDRERGLYADPDKVHYVNHQGRYFKARGPLNIPASPQGRPVIIQAGSSDRGRSFAGKWAEVIFTLAPDQAARRRFTDSIRTSLVEAGRAPDSCKVLPAIMPFIGKTRAEAEARRDLHNSLISPQVGLSTLAGHANVDLAGYPQDAPVDELRGSGTQGNLAMVSRIARERRMTLADVGREYGQSVMVPQICGTGGEVAEELAAIFLSGACDGFVVSPAFLPETYRDFVAEVIPHLQERGVFRKAYGPGTLRDRLFN